MSEPIAIFSAKSIGLSSVGGRKPCTLLDAARHNLREIQAELGAVGRIDPKRTHLNLVTAGPSNAKAVQAEAQALLATAGVVKLRRDHCQAVELLFSLPPTACMADPVAYFAKCLAWAASTMRLPVLSAVIHRDEHAPHMHVLLLPLQGRSHVGGAPVGLAAYKRLRDRFFAKVAGPAGLSRQSAKLYGVMKQWAVTAVLDHCNVLALPAANGLLWPVVVEAIKRDPTPALRALGIDVNAIRPAPTEPETNPIGIAANPKGLKPTNPLPVLGIAQSSAAQNAQKAACTLAELWELVGCKSRWTEPHQRRPSTINSTRQLLAA